MVGPNMQQKCKVAHILFIAHILIKQLQNYNQGGDMQLGQEVLNKISDLLVQIDKPKSPRRKPVKPEIPQVRSIYVNSDNRLYQNYKRLRDRAHEREKEKIKQQIQTIQQFKVDNKHSIFLNSRNNLKPIHERTTEIIRDRELSIQRKRTQVNIERERKRQLQEQLQQLQNEQVNQYCRTKSARRVTSKEELDQIVKRLTQRQRERHEKANREKMDYLKEKLMNNREKPNISKNTQRIWKKRKLKKQLSSNVFERFDRYVWDHKKKRQELVNSIRQRQTPFKPTISKNSIQILNKSTVQKAENSKRFDRSISCKCLSKKTLQKSTHYSPTHNKSNSSSQPHNILSQDAKSQVQFSPYHS